MNKNSESPDNDNLGIVAGHLWRLQNELDGLENKLSRTVLSLQSFLEEEEKEQDGTDENIDKIKSRPNTPTSELEENLYHRIVGRKDTEEYCKMVDTVCTNDLNGTENKIDGDLKNINYTWKTCDYWSLPKWLQDNYYILKGYRPPLPSFLICSHSIFRIHTETINIWTHLLGSLLFVVLFLYAMQSSLALEDKLVLSPFFVGAVLCLGFSSTFHTLRCHSDRVSTYCSRLDFCGITLLIVGSFVPWLYYGFFCDSRLKVLYLTGVLTLGICATVLSLSETFGQPFYRPLRATVFVVFGLSGVIPAIHFIFIDGWEVFCTFATPLLITAVFYIAGAFIYASRVPERFCPGKCDILFQSHQLFHVLVVVATLIDYIGIIRVAGFAQLGRKNPDFCLQRQFYYSKQY